MINDPESLIQAVKNMGFVQVEGKGEGVLEKSVTKRGERVNLIALISQRDASLLLYVRVGQPFKFHFKRNWRGAADYIQEYLGECS